MSVGVSLGGSTAYEADRAILIYRNVAPGYYASSGTAYTVQAKASPRPDGGIDLGPWEPATLEFVHELARTLGTDLPRELLPESVLCRTHEVVVWWTKPGIRTLFFDAKIAAVSGEDFPVPPLVWKLELATGRLFLRALRLVDARPTADSPLFVAPFLNVYSQGLVCQGSMRRPTRSTVDNLDEWERGFFGAAGSSQLTPKACTRGDLFSLWPRLKGKKAFPVGRLVAAGETLTQFISKEK